MTIIDISAARDAMAQQQQIRRQPVMALVLPDIIVRPDQFQPRKTRAEAINIIARRGREADQMSPPVTTQQEEPRPRERANRLAEATDIIVLPESNTASPPAIIQPGVRQQQEQASPNVRQEHIVLPECKPIVLPEHTVQPPA